MEMERSYFVIGYRSEYLALLARQRSGAGAGAATDEAPARIVVSITQGGFGQDVVDDERQVKERFLEHLFFSSGIDIPRSSDDFDRYFTIEALDELIDLDEEI